MTRTAAEPLAAPAHGRTNKEATVLTEACRLFANNGFDGTSIRDIASAAGISNAALYHYFTDKNELYARIVISVIERQCILVEKHIKASDTAAKKLRSFMRVYAEFFEDNPSEAIASSRSFGALEKSPQRDRAIYWRDRFEGVLRAIIREGIETGEFRKGDVALWGRAVLSCLNWMHRWYSPAGSMRPTEIAAGYADVLIAGFLNNRSTGRTSAKNKTSPR